jgi:integrase
MAFLVDTQELKPRLVIFRRADVKHRNWYCRVKLPKADRYKTVSLKTADIDAAREKAFDHDADVRFRIKHEVPIFNRPFSEIAKGYVTLQEERLAAGEISRKRLELVKSVIRAQLNRYVGAVQINLIGQDRWLRYPIWRKTDSKGINGRVSDATVRTEMSIFRAVMGYAASKRYITDSQAFKGKLSLEKVRREEFTPEEYRKLHTFTARQRGFDKKNLIVIPNINKKCLIDIVIKNKIYLIPWSPHMNS